MVNDPVAGGIEKKAGSGLIRLRRQEEADRSVKQNMKLVTDEAHHSHSEVAKTRFAKRLLDTYQVRPEATAKSTAG